MSSVYLLRHCEYENPLNILPGRLPVKLSPLGEKKAFQLRDHFQNKNISHIYASAVERAKQTAEIIAHDQIPITYDPRLLEGLSAYQGYWGENWHGDGFHFFSHHAELGGENFQDILVRVSDFWNEITENLQENIIICSHGDPLQILHSYIYRLPLADESKQENNIIGWLEKGEYEKVDVKL